MKTKILAAAAFILAAFIFMIPAAFAAETAAPPAAVDWYGLLTQIVGLLTIVLPAVFAWFKVKDGERKAAAIVDAANVGLNAAYLIGRKMTPEQRDEKAVALQSEAMHAAVTAMGVDKVNAKTAAALRSRINGGLGAIKLAGDTLERAAAAAVPLEPLR